jgi:magnesium transporter
MITLLYEQNESLIEKNVTEEIALLQQLVVEKVKIWVIVENPEALDWKILDEVFSFHHLSIEDAKKQNQRSKIESYDDYCFLSLRVLCDEPKELSGIGVQGVTSEIDVFIGSSFIVTVCEKNVNLGAYTHINAVKQTVQKKLEG